MDEESEVWAAGAEALGQMRASASVPKLEAAIKNLEVEVVLAATNALNLLGDSRAFEVYYAILTGERKAAKVYSSRSRRCSRTPELLQEWECKRVSA